MYGLAKIAEDQTINFNNNYSSREDRLLDKYEDARSRHIDFDSQRNPEVEAAANKIVRQGLGEGAGLGALGGALGGAWLGAQGSGNLRSKGMDMLGGGLMGGLTGAAVGLPVGGALGGVRAYDYRQNNEDPELLKNISQAKTERNNAEEALKRHYLMGERVKRQEAERLEARRELLGY